METVGYAALQVIPSVKGITSSIEGQLNGSGSRSGAAFASGFAGSAKRLVGVVGGLFVADRLVRFGASVVSTGAEFEQTMTTVGAATDTAGAKLKQMSTVARTAGTDLGFTARETAGAMLELGKAGIGTADIMGGALKGTLVLAAAGGTSLASASTIAANAMSAFSLSGKDMGAIAAAIAGGANASTASVESLGMALSQVGPGAVNAGLSLNDTIGVLAAFDQAGIKGSDSGTSLKTMLARLVPQTDAAASAMKKLGLNFVNADGSFKGITAISQQLQDSLGPLTEAQRTQALTTIFGSDATRAATVLMRNGAKGIQGYITATKDRTAAEKMAAARTAGTAGAIARMKAAIESAKISIAQGAAPAVAAFAGAIASGLPRAIPVLRSIYTWVADNIVPAVKDGARIIGAALGPAVDRIQSALAGAGASGSSFGTTLGNAIRQVSSVIATAITATSQLAAFLIRNKDVTVPLAKAVLALVVAYKVYKVTMAAAAVVTRAYRAVVLSVAVAQQAYAAGTYGMAAGQAGLAAKTANLAGRLRVGVTAMTAWTTATARSLAMNARWQVMMARQSLSNVVASLKQGVAAMAAWIAAQARAAAAAAVAGARAAAAWVASTAALVASKAAALAAAVASGVLRAATVAGTAAQWALNVAMTANPIGLVVVAIAALALAFVVAWKKSETFRSVVTGAWNMIRSVTTKAVSTVVNFVKNRWPLLLAIVAGPLGIIVALVIKNWGRIKSVTSSAWNGIRAVVSAVWGGIRAVVSAYVNTVRAVITGAWNAVRSATSRAWSAVRSAVTGAVRSIVTAVSGIRGKVMGAVSGAVTWLLGAGGDVIHGFISGIRSAAGGIIGAIKSAITDRLPAYVKKALGIHSPSRVFAAIARWIPAGMAKGVRDGSSAALKAIDAFVKKFTDAGSGAVSKLADKIYRDRIKLRRAVAAANDRTKGTKGDKRLPTAISKTEAVEMAKARVKATTEAARTAATILKAQKRLSKVWKGVSRERGTDRIVAGLTTSGSIAKGARLEGLTLADLARARETLAGRLASAKKKLADAIAVRDDFSKSVADAARSYATVLAAQGKVNIYGFQQAVSAADIVGTLRDRLAVIKKFTADMAALLKAGLNKTTYEQLIAAGPEAASDYAAALVAGGATAVGEVNGLQSDINAAAGSLGSQSSTALYQAGVDAAQGLVKGIESQIDKIDKAATRIAKALAKAIKKALGIKSPSRVAAAIGRFVPAGLAVGMTATTQMRRVAAAGVSVAGAAASGVRRGLRGPGGRPVIRVSPLVVPDLPYVPGPGDDGPGTAGGTAGGPRVVVHQTINNPQAEPTSKSVDRTARTLGMVGAI